MATRTNLVNNVQQIDATIPVGVTQSEVIDLAGAGIFGILAPSDFAGTSLTLEATLDEVTFFPILNRDGTTFTITISASEYCIVPISELPGVLKIRLVSSAAADTDPEVISIFVRVLS